MGQGCEKVDRGGEFRASLGARAGGRASPGTEVRGASSERADLGAWGLGASGQEAGLVMTNTLRTTQQHDTGTKLEEPSSGGREVNGLFSQYCSKGAFPQCTEGVWTPLRSTRAASRSKPDIDHRCLVWSRKTTRTYIKGVQENLNKIVSQISSSGSVDSLRIAVIKYRDHPPQDSTFVTQVVDFTSDLTAIRAAIGSMSPEGGGDGPEAVTAAFKDALALSYRDSAPKIIIFIADAPPHAIGEGGDGFPDKDPAGCDLLELIQSFEAKKLIVHAVGCEPAISQYQYARDLFKAIAERTGGRYVTLANVAILSTIITGVALEEVSLAQVQDSVNQAVQEEVPPGRGGVCSHQLQVDSVHEANSDASRVRLFLEMLAADISSCSLAAAAPSFMMADSLAAPQAQTASISHAPISLEQIRRMSARSTPRSSAPPQKESS
ncbi:putative Alpha-protein kinase vwkA [Paratrimastix pyriformis]|uniref:Alpha-protein kinase vwkA n=1 Tax=Paratrimastix pyriformis TaxID=342808 RepID=A0ABQ8UNS0_9EUKA|nr:putative Alpha-protein kinase vwkA [Paratrimastix pyriformis]